MPSDRLRTRSPFFSGCVCPVSRKDVPMTESVRMIPLCTLLPPPSSFPFILPVLCVSCVVTRTRCSGRSELLEHRGSRRPAAAGEARRGASPTDRPSDRLTGRRTRRHDDTTHHRSHHHRAPHMSADPDPLRLVLAHCDHLAQPRWVDDAFDFNNAKASHCFHCRERFIPFLQLGRSSKHRQQDEQGRRRRRSGRGGPR